ncbi:hypothetical protein QLX08_011245 [Tetragonisca angustula]|uniref:Uncharacterized protein n=1 Tax=Tetragonisca angustula TaxID=166442 RepID=A0AAW0Z8Q9_9HYME
MIEGSARVSRTEGEQEPCVEEEYTRKPPAGIIAGPTLPGRCYANTATDCCSSSVCRCSPAHFAWPRALCLLACHQQHAPRSDTASSSFAEQRRATIRSRSLASSSSSSSSRRIGPLSAEFSQCSSLRFRFVSISVRVFGVFRVERANYEGEEMETAERVQVGR